MKLHAGPLLHKNVIDCHKCGFAHWHPLPDASTVARYYEEDKFYSQHSPPGWFLKEREEYEAGLWDSYYDYLAGFLSRSRYVFDIGAGCGWMVTYLGMKKGFTAFGLEPSFSARAFLPNQNDMFMDWEQFTRRYPGAVPKGNIVLMLTLEHILDPETWLREEVLPHLDGRLIVVVPNEFNPLQKALGTTHFISPVHLNYFTPKTLRGLLERLGLTVVAEGATFPMEIFSFIGRNHIGNDEMGRRNHLLRLKLEKALGVRAFKLYRILYKFFGVGREIIMVAERR